MGKMSDQKLQLLDHVDHAGPSGPQDSGSAGISYGPQRRTSSATLWIKTLTSPSDWTKVDQNNLKTSKRLFKMSIYIRFHE